MEAFESVAENRMTEPTRDPAWRASLQDSGQRVWSFEVQNLVAQYEGKQVLRVDTLTCPSVGVTALLGPSGCGKSTLLKLLADLMDSNLTYRGTIRDFGHERQPNSGDDPKAAFTSRYSMVWQTPILFPCSILDNLVIPLRKRGIPKKRWRPMIEESLASVGLRQELGPSWAGVQGDQISVGQRQRACIARCLLQDSGVILLDEPCAALDPVSTAKVEVVMSLLARTRAVVLVTHNLGQARRLARHAAVFCVDESGGYVCECGEASECLHEPQTEEGRTFILREVGR